jgi:hypothetical protein
LEDEMSKTYLVSEELLRQVLDDALKDDLYEVVNSLRTLLAKEPSEPVAWSDCLGQVRVKKELEFLEAKGDQRFRTYDTPLYRKDTP